MLLTKEELIEGWWKVSDDTNAEATPGQESTAPECLQQSATLRTSELADSAEAGWYWPNSETVEEVYSSAFVYPSSAAAAAAYIAYEQRARGCTTWDVRTVFREEQQLYPVQIGDQAFGRMTNTTSLQAPEVVGGHQYWAVSRVGNVIVEAAYFPGPYLDTTNGQARTVKLAARAAQKAN